MNPPDRSRIVCERVTHRIKEVVPSGLGHWDQAWDLVEVASAAFEDALGTFLVRDTQVSRAHLEQAVDELVRAWRCAGQAWEEAGKPGRAQETLGAERDIASNSEGKSDIPQAESTEPILDHVVGSADEPEQRSEPIFGVKSAVHRGIPKAADALLR